MSYFDNKSILITGATGLICSNLADRILGSSNAKVFLLGRNEEKLRNRFSYASDERVEFIVQDASLPIEIDADIDIIYHGAGPIDKQTIISNPVDVIMPNIVGLLNCLKIALRQNDKEKKCRLVVFSSATVYGDRGKDAIFSELDDFCPVSIYSDNACYFEAKRMSEVIALSFAKQYSLDVVIARFSYVYGYTEFVPNTAFYQFISRLFQGNDITMNNSGLGRRDNIFINDVINGLFVITGKGLSGEIYNISSNGDMGNYAAIDEIAETMVKVFNRKNGSSDLKVVYANGRSDNRLNGISLDNSKLKELGWNIETSLEDGIESIISSYTQTSHI